MPPRHAEGFVTRVLREWNLDNRRRGMGDVCMASGFQPISSTRVAHMRADPLVMPGVGAAIDFHPGNKPQAPAELVRHLRRGKFQKATNLE